LPPLPHSRYGLGSAVQSTKVLREPIQLKNEGEKIFPCFTQMDGRYPHCLRQWPYHSKNASYGPDIYVQRDQIEHSPKNPFIIFVHLLFCKCANYLCPTASREFFCNKDTLGVCSITIAANVIIGSNLLPVAAS